MRRKVIVVLLTAACCAMAQGVVRHHNDFSSAAGMHAWTYSGAQVDSPLPFEDPNYDPITCVTLYCAGGGPAGGGYNYLWMTAPLSPVPGPGAAILKPGAPFDFTGCNATVISRTDTTTAETVGQYHPCFLRVYSGAQDPNGNWTQLCRATAYFSYFVNSGWNNTTPGAVTTLPMGTPGFTGDGTPTGPVDRAFYNGGTVFDPAKVINYRFDDPTWDTSFFPRQITIDDLLVETPAPPVVCGDANCDGFVNNGDIDAFILAITDSTTYAATYPGCPLANSDTNLDTFTNNGDIDSFIAYITSSTGGCGL